jgi:uncharacterized protein YndB with AHSA1/START domain
MAQALVVKVQLMIRRPAAEVYEAFVDPAITTRFWFSKSSGRLEVGQKVGWDWEMYGAHADVTVKALVPGRLILIEWSGPAPEVEWRFTARGPDATLVEVTNSGFAGEGDAAVAAAIDSKGGFTSLLAGAKAWLEHGVMLELVADHHPDALVPGWSGRSPR